jgi:hypothetical protein
MTELYPKTTEALSLRMNKKVKDRLRVLAAMEHRSLTNMIEVLITRDCKLKGLSLDK